MAARISFMSLTRILPPHTLSLSFVPSLNVLATRFRIPDDVAGATLMAGGASSPELLAMFTTLFITHSELGIGTIIGSEIFNQLMICAGSILAGT